MNHTISRIIGKGRVSGVEVAQVDENRKIICKTKEMINCDTLLLSVGLLPELELMKKIGIKFDEKTNGPIIDNRMQTNIQNVFACGNVAYVHDLVDIVSSEAEIAGENASKYVRGEINKDKISVKVKTGKNILMAIPQVIKDENAIVRFRVKRFIDKGKITITDGDAVILTKNIVNYSSSEMHSIDVTLNQQCEQITIQVE